MEREAGAYSPAEENSMPEHLFSAAVLMPTHKHGCSRRHRQDCFMTPYASFVPRTTACHVTN